jgi:hypothetical protein
MGYRLLTTSVTVGLGISKAICSHRGQFLVADTGGWTLMKAAQAALAWVDRC